MLISCWHTAGCSLFIAVARISLTGPDSTKPHRNRSLPSTLVLISAHKVQLYVLELPHPIHPPSARIAPSSVLPSFDRRTVNPTASTGVSVVRKG